MGGGGRAHFTTRLAPQRELTFERQGPWRGFGLVPGGIPTETMGGVSDEVVESRWPLSLQYLYKLELLDMVGSPPHFSVHR